MHDEPTIRSHHDILAMLDQWPPDDVYEDRDMLDEETGAKTDLVYLSHFYIRDRLNEIFPLRWSHTVSHSHVEHFGKTTKGKDKWVSRCIVSLRVWTPNGWIEHSEPGVAITYGSGELAIQGEKQAASDGLRRVAWNLGKTFQVAPHKRKAKGKSTSWSQSRQTPPATPPPRRSVS